MDVLGKPSETGARSQSLAAGRLVEGQQAQQVPGQDGHGEFVIDLDDHRGGQAVEAEERQLLGDRPPDQPAGHGCRTDSDGPGGRQGRSATACQCASSEGDLRQARELRLPLAHEDGRALNRLAVVRDHRGRAVTSVETVRHAMDGLAYGRPCECIWSHRRQAAMLGPFPTHPMPERPSGG